MITVIANGKKYTLDESATITELLSRLGWKPTQVVVEHNGRVLAREELSQVRLSDGDRLEVVVPVAGG